MAFRLRASTTPLHRLSRPTVHPHLLRIRLMSTKQFEYILTSRPADGVAQITLNRPKALNALCTPLFTELNEVAKEFDEDDSVRAVVLTGSERAFAGTFVMSSASEQSG